jgi:hypothetical protein
MNMQDNAVGGDLLLRTQSDRRSSTYDSVLQQHQRTVTPTNVKIGDLGRRQSMLGMRLSVVREEGMEF